MCELIHTLFNVLYIVYLEENLGLIQLAGTYFPCRCINSNVCSSINGRGLHTLIANVVMFILLQGYNCCSDTAISFNGISHQMMYTLNYLIYHLRPWGISSHPAFNLTEVQLLINWTSAAQGRQRSLHLQFHWSPPYYQLNNYLLHLLATLGHELSSHLPGWSPQKTEAATMNSMHCIHIGCINI